MLHIVLFEPEIPPNTGNIIRLAANTGCQLHLIEPLGFELDDKRLTRAGLDYAEWQDVKTYRDWADYLHHARPQRVFALSIKCLRQIIYEIYIIVHQLVLRHIFHDLLASTHKTLPTKQLLRTTLQVNISSMNFSDDVSVVVY